MRDTTKMSAEEVRDVLVKEYDMTRTEVDAIKGKSNVVAKLREYEADDAILETAEMEESVVPTTREVELTDEQMNWNNPKWTEHVIGLMYEDELFEGHPKVDGLRRIADVLMGPIRQVTSNVEQTPDLNNNFHATVKVTVATDNELVDGCADAGPNNTQASFAKHPVAVAESRAEGRAYRKLLRLRNIISAEEAVSDEQIIDPYEAINSTQIKMIDKYAGLCNINVEKFLGQHNIELSDYTRISKSKASELCALINKMHTDGKENVPEDIQGYDFNWR